jgi:hypothetical protein
MCDKCTIYYINGYDNKVPIAILRASGILPNFIEVKTLTNLNPQSLLLHKNSIRYEKCSQCKANNRHSIQE